MNAYMRTSLVALLLGTGASAMAIEQPNYRVIDKKDDLEIRQYGAYIVAETFVEGDFGDSGNEGFQRLFRYITGGNQARAEISMTTPVAQRPGGQKIAMTAPVGQVSEGNGHWISFMMPSQFTMATLPQPIDPRVRLREVPGQLMAVLRYSGFWGETRYRKEEARLRELVEKRGLVAAGEAQFARYDPPFMPPFMRRNEIMIPLASLKSAQFRQDASGDVPTTAMAH